MIIPKILLSLKTELRVLFCSASSQNVAELEVCVGDTLVQPFAVEEVP